MANTIDKQKKLARLQKKESDLVNRGNRSVDEGKDKKADRLLKKASNVENRIINKYKKGGVKSAVKKVVVKAKKKK